MTVYGPFRSMEQRVRIGELARRQSPRRGRWQWLLSVPLVLALLTPLYNRIEPRLFGIPFFYWYQLALVGVDIAVITTVYQLTKER